MGEILHQWPWDFGTHITSAANCYDYEYCYEFLLGLLSLPNNSDDADRKIKGYLILISLEIKKTERAQEDMFLC